MLPEPSSSMMTLPPTPLTSMPPEPSHTRTSPSTPAISIPPEPSLRSTAATSEISTLPDVSSISSGRVSGTSSSRSSRPRVSAVCTSIRIADPDRVAVSSTRSRSSAVPAQAVPDARTLVSPGRPSMRNDPARARTVTCVASPTASSAARGAVRSHCNPLTKLAVQPVAAALAAMASAATVNLDALLPAILMAFPLSSAYVPGHAWVHPAGPPGDHREPATTRRSGLPADHGHTAEGRA